MAPVDPRPLGQRGGTLQARGQQRVDAMRSAIVFGLEPSVCRAHGGCCWASTGWAGLSGLALIVASGVQPAPAVTTRRRCLGPLQAKQPVAR